MPKRQNPFGDFSPMQLKQHIGQKEIDLGISQDKNMHQVYEKTRQLLFAGSKKKLQVGVDANCNTVYESSSDRMMEVEDSTQMHITNDGHLTVMEDKPRNAFQALFMARQARAQSGCQCCKGQAASQDRCGFCEKAICQDCVRCCTGCQENFCQLCSVMSSEDVFPSWYCQKCSYRLNPYSDSIERSFCLNCAS